MTATLTIPTHTRRKPIDPHAAVREETTERLRIAVAVERMERELAEVVRQNVKEG